MSTKDLLRTPFSMAVVPNRAEVAAIPAGEVDIATATEFETTVADLLAVGFETVVVDLRDVEFIDSTGLRALLRLRDSARQHRCRLSLISPRESTVLRIFDVTGSYGLFDWRACG